MISMVNGDMNQVTAVLCNIMSTSAADHASSLEGLASKSVAVCKC